MGAWRTDREKPHSRRRSPASPLPASPEERSERDGPAEGNPSGGDRERCGFARECDWNVDPSDLAEVSAQRLTPHTHRDGPARRPFQRPGSLSAAPPTADLGGRPASRLGVERRRQRCESAATTNRPPAPGRREEPSAARLTAQRHVLVLIPFQSLVDLLNGVVGPHLIHHIEVRID